MAKIFKNLTYDEISKKLNLSTQQVHKIEKDAFNKIFKRTSISGQFTPVEVILGMCSEFGIQPDQCYNKLTNDNKNKVIEYVNEEYGFSLELLDDGNEFELIDRLFS